MLFLVIRAVHTWKSGHRFCAPLVSGSRPPRTRQTTVTFGRIPPFLRDGVLGSWSTFRDRAATSSNSLQRRWRCLRSVHRQCSLSASEWSFAAFCGIFQTPSIRTSSPSRCPPWPTVVGCRGDVGSLTPATLNRCICARSRTDSHVFKQRPHHHHHMPHTPPLPPKHTHTHTHATPTHSITPSFPSPFPPHPPSHHHHPSPSPNSFAHLRIAPQECENMDGWPLHSSKQWAATSTTCDVTHQHRQGAPCVTEG